MSTGALDSGARTVLLCDDQRELREAISELLGNFPRFQVVGQAVDGVSCLHRIADSKPDIVIMDVSLPGGGAELVRGARSAHPDMHIVMFSGHDEASLQADMLDAGADCYVIKTGRLKPLIEAMDSRPQRPHEPAVAEVPAARGHTAFCYRDDRELIPHLAEMATVALADTGRLVVIATPEHRAALHRALPVGMVDCAIGEGRFVELDAEATLAAFVRRGVPDPILFDRTVGAVVRAQSSGPGPVRAWGEMVSLLWERGNVVGTLRLEQLWSELQRRVAFHLVCGYRIADQPDEANGGFAAISDLHTEVSGHCDLESRRAG